MKEFFTNNRAGLIAKLKGGLIVLTAYSSMQRSNDTAFAFEQEANFWWLCGIEVAEWWIIIDGVRGKSWLVAPTISAIHQQFDGSLSPEDALKISGVDAVISENEAASLLRGLAKTHSVVHTLGKQPYAEYLNFILNPAPKKLHETLTRTFNSVQDCRKELSQLRAIKQPVEVARMKQAINLTIDAFDAMKANLQNLKYEYEIEAELTYYFRMHGAKGHAFDPIVAAGKNACTIHYLANAAKLKKRELVLLDIGVRHREYVSDIARTYAYGEPTKRQQEVYGAIKSAHVAIIKLLKPGMSVEQYQRDTDNIMADTLVRLGLMKGRDDQQNYRKYFPNAISHGLGIDNHDSLGAPHFFQSGMVLTVEPGVYIPDEGIGVRIEDDILISETGHTNLSARLSTDL